MLTEPFRFLKAHWDALDLVHRIRKSQATKHICAVMSAAGISGAHASPKGLRHGFGIRAASETRNPRLVQKWLGHRYLETTTIYMDAVGAEERELAARMWV